MSSPGDFIRTTYLLDYQGVQMQNSQDWEILSIDGADTLATILLDLATAYWNSWKAVVVSQCTLSCLKFYNYNTTEQDIAYPGLAGQGGTDGHPQFQVVRLNLYGQAATPPNQPIYRNASNLSGVKEDLSTRGRINDLAEFSSWAQFHTAAIQTSPTGWTLGPVARYTVAAGPPPTYGWVDMIASQVNPTFQILRGRKTKICAAM